MIRLTLTFKSYKPVLEHIKKIEGSNQNYRHPLTFVWAVSSTAKLVPKASCLTQALAVRWLLARAALSSKIRIGVATDHTGEFKAHAWVIYRNAIIIGGEEKNFDTYTPIVDL